MNARIKAKVVGPVSGQVAIGQDIVQIRDLTVVQQATAPPVVRPRPRPLVPAVRAPTLFVDRVDVLALFASAEDAALDIAGEPGSGKTALVKRLLHEPAGQRFPDGGCYLRARRLDLGDVLQQLFLQFYEVDGHFRPGPSELQQLLGEIKALVALDDLAIGADDATEVLDVLRSSTVLLVSRTALAVDGAPPVDLAGLPEEDALALLEHRIGDRLTGEAREAAAVAVRRLDCLPGAVVQLVSEARLELRTLAEVEPGEDAARALELRRVRALDGAARASLQALAVADAPLSREQIEAAAGTGSVEVLGELEGRDLIERVGNRFVPAPRIAFAAEEAWGATALGERVLEAIARTVEGYTEPTAVRDDAEAILSALEWAERNGQDRSRLRLARRVAAVLAVAGLWGAWRATAAHALDAAEALGDVSGQAWANHELGASDLALGDVSSAQRRLEQADALWGQVADEARSAATRRMLYSARRGSRLGLRLLFWSALVALVLGLAVGGLGVAGLLPGSSGAPIGIEPSALDFSDVAIGSVAEPRVVSVANRRGHAVAVRAAVTGDGDFAVAGCESPLPPRGECELTVSFAPRIAGARAANVAISTEAHSRVVELAGSGRHVARLAVTPPLLEFGSVTVGGRASLALDVDNDGTRGMKIRASTRGSRDFATAGCKEPVAPGSSCALTVRFTPSVAATRTGTVLVEAPGVDPVRVDLMGVGTDVVRVEVRVSPTALEFGNVAVGTAAAPRLMTISNRGTVARRPGFAVTGAGFDVSGCETALPPRASCEAEVRFRPAGAGEATGRLTVTFAGAQPGAVALRGVGVAEVVLLASATPPKLSFGDVLVGMTSAPQDVTVRNGGTADVTLSATLPTTSVFRAGGCTEALHPKESCTVSLTFAPVSAERSSAELVLDYGADEPLRVNLDGTGTTAPTFEIDATPTELDFGEVLVGQTSAARGITVRNVGSAAVQVELGIPPSRGFQADGCGETLPPGETCTVSVVFEPSGGKPATASLVVQPDGGSPHSVALRGSGAFTYAVAPTPSSVDFGEVVVADAAQRTVTVKNAGSGAFRLSAVAGDGFSVDSGDCDPGPIRPGKGCELRVRFEPAALGSSTASLTLDPEPGDPVAVSLSGLGVARFRILPEKPIFPSTFVGARGRMRISVTNLGKRTVTVKPRLDGQHGADFAIEGNSCASPLAGGGRCEFLLTFAPAAAGPRAADLLLVPDAGPEERVQLAGAGATRANLALTGDQDTGEGRASFQLTVTNSGPSPATNVVLEARFPPRSRPVQVPTHCRRAFLPDNVLQVTCTIETLAATKSVLRTIRIAYSANASILAKVSGNDDDPDPENNEYEWPIVD